MSYIKTNVSQIGDPFVLREGNVYYMYATSSEEGFKVYRSEDLAVWEDLGLCYEGKKGWGYMDFWAPEVVPCKGGYAMFFTAKAKKSDSLRTGVAFAESPAGPFCDTGAPLFDFGYSTIDASPFFDDDGQAYLYYVRDCNDNVIGGVHVSQIYVTRLAPDLRSVEGEGALIATPDCAWECRRSDWQWNEGPSVIKAEGKYYLTYSVNCFDSPDYSVGYAVAGCPTGPFVKAAENHVLYRREGMSGPGHNSFFTDAAGQLRAAFHIHTDPARPSGDRTACICGVSLQGGRLRFLL